MWLGSRPSRAPNALQVADRWHLPHNLTDAVERLLERRSAVIRRVAMPESQAAEKPEGTAALTDPLPTPAPPRADRAKTTRRARRLDRYHQVVEMRKRGLSQSSIARQVGLDVRTIRRWLSAERFPERKDRPPVPSKLIPHRTYLEARFREGCTNAAQLWRELRERGFTGGSSIVRSFVRHLRTGRVPSVPSPRRRPSLHRLAWLFTLADAELKPHEQGYVRALLAHCPELEQVRQLAGRFRQVLQDRDVGAFDSWLVPAVESLLGDFATSLGTDLSAVRAAVEQPWSNG